MTMKKNVLASIASCLPVFLFAGQIYADELVAIERANIASAQETCEIRIGAKLDRWAVGFIPEGLFQRLKSIDSEARLIDANPNRDMLWISDKNGAVSLGIIFETEHHYLLRIEPAEAQRLFAQGVRLVKFMDMNLPPDKQSAKSSPMAISPMIMTDIDSLINLVSVDSVRSYLERLEAFRTRYTNTDSFYAAADWIADKFQSWGYDSVTFQDFSFWMGNSRNVIATKAGQVYPDKVIVVGGHFDSVVYDGGDPTIYAPGADDNGTGTAMTMEIARVLANEPMKKTIKFIAFGAEEQGLIGSEFYVAWALENHENIELMINADMIGNVADDYLDFNVRCNENGFPYGQVLARMAEDHTVLLPYIEIGEFGGSDHYPFDQAGFRTVYSDEGDFSPNWHLQSDIIENIDVPYATDIMRSNLGMLVVASGAPSPVLGLAATNSGNGNSVYLNWNPSSDGQVTGYEVYFGQPQSLIIYDSTSATADTVYGLQDDSLYYFAVVGITADGERSLIEEIVPCMPRSQPTRPDTLTITPEPGQLRIQWTPSPDLDFTRYQLYRRIGQDGALEPYQHAQSAEYVDQNLQPDTRYYYNVTALDTTGLESAHSASDYAKILSFDSGILLVDETRDGNGSQGQPNDAQQDSFYTFISENYPVTFHDIQQQGLLRINDLGPYSTVAWLDDDASVHKLLDVDDDLGRYLSVGGNLFFAGWRSLYSYGNNRPMQFGPGSFMFDYSDVDWIYSSSDRDFTGATGLNGWPSMQVIPEKVIPSFEGKLMGIDVLGQEIDSNSIYTYNSFSGDTLALNRPVGKFIRGNNYKLIYLTFPLYPASNDNAREIFIRAMDMLGEARIGVEEGMDQGILPRAFLTQNYPNPFNAQTKISFYLPRTSMVRLSVYNILGQEVAVLADGEFKSGYHALDWSANQLSSGIYLYRLTADDNSQCRRMVIVK